MGIRTADCERMLSTALSHGKNVFVVKQNRYSPPIKWLKELIESTILGKVFSVSIDCFWNRDDRYYLPKGWRGTKKLDGGVLFTQFSHFIDIMYWVFGDIENIRARHYNNNNQDNTEFDDSGLVFFDFVKEGKGALNYTTSVWDKNMESSITVIGEKGSVKIGGQYMNEVSFCHIEDYELPQLPQTNAPNDYGLFKGSAANHHFVIENVLKTLSGEELINANAMDGLKVVNIIERIYNAKD